MGLLHLPTFWVGQDANVGRLQTDESLKFVLLDARYSMMPLVRSAATTFTSFLALDSDAKKCKVIVNGNFFDLDVTGKKAAVLGQPDDPSNTLIQGRVVRDGKIIGGDSRPQSFWFGQLRTPTPLGWTYLADKGDPPLDGATLSAIGGVAPLIVGALTYGADNLYRLSAPPGVGTPATGEPPAAAMPYLIQRNNETFRDANALPRANGKTILAFCSQKQMLLVAVQPHGAPPGQSIWDLAVTLGRRGFESAVFLDGSDSVTLVVDGKIEVTPADRKNIANNIGVGFFLP